MTSVFLSHRRDVPIRDRGTGFDAPPEGCYPALVLAADAVFEHCPVSTRVSTRSVRKRVSVGIISEKTPLCPSPKKSTRFDWLFRPVDVFTLRIKRRRTPVGRSKRNGVLPHWLMRREGRDSYGRN